VGAEVARSADALVAVGELAATIAAAAERNGMRVVHRAADGGEALVRLRQLLRPGDTVLVKGSRALALDKLADELVRTEAPI
jgi:UDP-N-acetylmuramyl pentapeptide synthase